MNYHLQREGNVFTGVCLSGGGFSGPMSFLGGGGGVDISGTEGSGYAQGVGMSGDGWVGMSRSWVPNSQTSDLKGGGLGTHPGTWNLGYHGIWLASGMLSCLT